MKKYIFPGCAGLLCLALQVRAAEPEAATPQQRFDVLEYRVLGNTVLPAIDVERTLYPLLGTQKVLADVESARATLENAYRAAGYGTVFVDIPEQDTGEGIIRLKVTEGRLERTTVTGARYFSGRQIKAALPEASEGTVPHLPTLQQELSAFNAKSSDRAVTPVLAAGKSPGTMGLSLTVQDELPLHGRVEVNNQYTRNTTKTRAVAAVSYDNLFQRLDSLSLQFQTAPEEMDEAKVWAASYTARLPDASSRLAAFYIKSDSTVATVGDGGTEINVLGRGDIYGLRYIRTLAAGQESTHVLVSGLEHKDFKESIFSSDLLQTPISYVNFSLGHLSSWRMPQTQWSLSTTANVGFRGRWGNPDEFRAKRSQAQPNYVFVRGDASLTQALPLQTSLRLRLGGQYAEDSIISNEQYSIAGSDGVRGYLEAEVLGDVAVKSSLELASPTWRAGSFNSQVFGFVDAGHMRRRNPLREETREGVFIRYLEPRHVELASVGIGAQLSMWGTVSADLAWAYPLKDTPADDGTRAHDSHLHFGLRTSW